MAAMAAERWLIVRVELNEGSGERIKPPPGRDLLVSTSHSFLEFAVAIDTGFARWDRGHLHLFRFPGGAEYMLGGDEDDPDIPDTETTSLRDLVLAEGTTFEYIFDFGDEWVHRCEVRATGVDPETVFGDVPIAPVPLFGWGTIPDQYGRTAPDD
jgi:Plasmid pRiA4b ORF-3-like protein